MAINVQVQTKAEQQQEMRDLAKAKALEAQARQEQTTPVVNAFEEMGMNAPELNQTSVAAEEINPTTPGNLNHNQEITSGVPKETLQMREDLNRQRDERKVALQQEMERIKPISSEPGWNQYQDQTADAFGQSIDRSNKFTKLFHDKLDDGSSVGGVWLDQAGTQAMEGLDVNITDIADTKGEPISKLSPKGILFDKHGFNAGMINDTGKTVVNPEFAKVMGVITEISLTGSDIKNEGDTGFENEMVEAISEPESFARNGSQKLGREIFRNWKRVENANAGNPTDQYDEGAVDPNQYEIIGTLAKEMYHLANPDMLDRVTNLDEAGNKNVQFQLTPLGASRINAAKKDRPDLFASQEIKPTSVPRPVIEKHGGSGETAKFRKGTTTAVVNQKQKQIEIGRTNMNSVAHVVDPKRRKIMMQLGIQALKEIKQNGTSRLGDLFDIGPKKLEYFEGELAKKLHEVDGDTNKVDYDPQQEYNKHVVKFINTMNTAAVYSNKPNHLDFAWQQLQNRMHVEQTKFNPQGNPWLRFVTGPAKPDVWTVNDRSHADLMFKELMAVHFLGAKNLLPKNRIEAFNQDWNSKDSKLRKIAEAGQAIEETLMSPEIDQQMTDAFKQVQTNNTGTTSVPPQLANVPALNIPESILSPALKEGLEGLSLIEAAAELAKYSKGGKMHSNISPEFDGKTHGPATNMAQLGIESGAYRTGVLRKEGATKNLDNFTLSELYNGKEVEVEAQAGDLRDGMRQYMLAEGQAAIDNTFGTLEMAEPMWQILQAATKDRVNFLKKPPMTLGYGQLLKNLRAAVETTVFSGDSAIEIGSIIKNARKDIEKKAEKGQTAEDVVIDFLHTMLADSINANMDPEVINVGQTLRANNAIAMLSNEVMTIQNALGFPTYIGAKQRSLTGEKINLDITKEGKRGSVGAVQLAESKPAGSAVREGRPGGWGRGRVIPAVIQGIDGAWMNKMFTKSWPDLKNSYMLPIMDAVKTNLSSARKVREHANNNWWNTIQEYSYVDEIMGKWAPETINKFRSTLMGMDPKIKLPIDMESDYRGFGYLLDPTSTTKAPFKNLRDFIGDTFEFRPRNKGESISDYELEKKFAAIEIAKKIVPNLYKKGPGQPPLSELSPAQMLDFFDRIVFYLDIKKRNAKTVNKTKSRRNSLFNKAKNSEILQVDLG